jgi:hypothetical protein
VHPQWAPPTLPDPPYVLADWLLPQTLECQPFEVRIATPSGPAHDPLSLWVVASFRHIWLEMLLTPQPRCTARLPHAWAGGALNPTKSVIAAIAVACSAPKRLDIVVSDLPTLPFITDVPDVVDGRRHEAPHCSDTPARPGHTHVCEFANLLTAGRLVATRPFTPGPPARACEGLRWASRRASSDSPTDQPKGDCSLGRAPPASG